ncbi:damage-control phosphatase ARMT1 family protein [Thermincola potens]|uniref:Damage-control phosphatase ARMT1-like metal-binding domain-containing protein n=1 Tax=Thermincola potens (strain JR) TaxID=635013 RepID=D5XEZ0_THEPJ|nr:ARMT1-like domain-containing protein [Thermincola potens]ADG82211.1 protein of unknown function DUF89 [Thermincola potens JR]
MLVSAECIPCYLQQAINTLEKGEVPRAKWNGLLKQLLPLISSLPDDKTPAENSTMVIHRLAEMLGGNDPFFKAKEESNKRALSYIKDLRGTIAGSEDPLFTALKISVAGNVVDLGLFDDFDLTQALEDALKFDFTINDYDRFKQDIAKAETVLIIGDNSGEIVFDRLLAEQLRAMHKEVFYGVKGGFILNDATIQDAYTAGLPEVARVITNGNSYLGTVEKYCSEEFLTVFQNADTVISKGQANYESLEGTVLAGEKTYFLLKAKCPLVAKHLGVRYGAIVFKRNAVDSEQLTVNS